MSEEEEVLGSQRAYSKLSSRMNQAPLWLPHQRRASSPEQPHEKSPVDHRIRSSSTHAHESAGSRCQSKERKRSERSSSKVRFHNSVSESSSEECSGVPRFDPLTTPMERLSLGPEKPPRLSNQSPAAVGKDVQSSLYPSLSEQSGTPVRLSRTAREREYMDNLSNLFAVINSLELLDKVFVRDYVSSPEYSSACAKLLLQYRTTFEQIQSDEFPSIEVFMKKYGLNCPLALKRIRENAPLSNQNPRRSHHKHVANTVAAYITLMDKLHMGFAAIDELQPEMRELLDAINLLGTELPDDFEGRRKIIEWLRMMDSMAAADRFELEQVRQMKFDLESGYSTFLKLLHEA